MVDSGASGEGFVDPDFARRCGAAVRPSSRLIVLADGTEVSAAGEATITYTLETRPCHAKKESVPVQFTSKFIVTPLAPHELILGIGWLERHHALIGFGERSFQLRVDGAGKQHCIRPLARCNDDGSAAAKAAPVHLKAIVQRRLCKLMRRGQVEELYAVLVKPLADADTGKAAADKPPLGSDDPRVARLLAEFKGSVFGEPRPGVPRKRGVEHAIQLKPGATPPAARPLRHQSEKDAQVIREYVEAGLKSGMLRPSVSPYGSMTLIAKKKDGSPRVCVDYRAVNEMTVKNKYPLPLMDELFDRTQGARVFSTIDLRNGFHQIAIQPGDREKTAFRTRFGLFEYTVLPMGLCNAPGTFMQLMNQTFADMLDKCVLCFLDDILIFSRTEEEHLGHIREVLTRLRDQELYVKPSKCAFMQREVGFLGHRIGADGLRVEPDKIGAVKNWPQPKNVTDVRSFLGLANFYRRFVRGYSRLALPLTELTCETKNAWRWGAEEQAAFEQIKEALCSPPVLLVPDQTKPFVLNCDACKYAYGATLQQDHGNGLQPVAYFSAKMSPAERNYDVREQEFLALVEACTHWRHYLHGLQPFTLLSDHDSLKYHKTMPNIGGRLARWIERMAEFDYTLQHIPGKSNVVADALSRRADHAELKALTRPEAWPLARQEARPLRGILKKGVTFATTNPYEALAAARVRRGPDTPEKRQQNIDAATRNLPRAADLPAPNKAGTIETPTQTCAADTKAGTQCRQPTAVAHLCWNHLRRDMGLRVKKSTAAGAGRGLFVARKEGLPAGFAIPYTGDVIPLDEGNHVGGTYVLETRDGEGIDAARRNCGLGRWVNDPRGVRDARGRAMQPNCEFAIHTPAGSQQRIAAVRTLRPVLNGEELFVRYGAGYWRFQAGTGVKGRQSKAAQERRQRERKQPQRIQPERGARARDRQFEIVMMATMRLAAAETAALSLAAAKTRSAPRSKTAGTAEQDKAAESAPEEKDDRAERPEALLSALRRAAAADDEYRRWLQAPPPSTEARGGLLWVGNKMRVPRDAALRTRILSELHDSVTGAHAGRDRMLAALQRRFEWRGMADDVQQYVLTCDSCQRNKHSKQLKPGLLIPLPLPEEPCLHWTTDAVTGLPRTPRGFDAIQVYVDRCTKTKRFAKAKTTDGSAALADTTLDAIVRVHGVPKTIVSDRDPRITAAFWRQLWKRMGAVGLLSTAYHAQSDGQSEREVQSITTALRMYANAMGDDWDLFLPALELGFNSMQQASTGAAPFTLLYGTEARLPIDCALDDAGGPTTLPAVAAREERIRKALALARTSAQAAQARQKRLADRHRRELQLKAGDKVLLATENLRLRSGTHKLTARYIGPFRVLEMKGPNAATLELPPLLGALHPTVNISRLKLYRDADRERFPDRPRRLHAPPAVDADTNGESSYEVEAVTAQRGPRTRRELLVRWKGYGPEHDEWRPRAELVESAPVVVAEFDVLQQGGSERAAHVALSQLEASGRARRGRAASPSSSSPSSAAAPGPPQAAPEAPAAPPAEATARTQGCAEETAQAPQALAQVVGARCAACIQEV